MRVVQVIIELSTGKLVRIRAKGWVCQFAPTENELDEISEAIKELQKVWHGQLSTSTK